MVIKNWIGGKLKNTHDNDYIKKFNPHDGKFLYNIVNSKINDINDAIDSAHEAFKIWSDFTPVKRGQILGNIVLGMKSNMKQLSECIATETGKSIKDAHAEVNAAILQAEFFAGEGMRLYGKSLTSGMRGKYTHSVRQPHGIVGLIVPANTPIANIAWKTGTSFGFRDAWAVGVNAKYVVGVWVGNADGEGRPGVIGAEAAAPLMFEVFSGLPDAVKWFLPPYNTMIETNTCLQSGFAASPNCPDVKAVWTTKGAENASFCQFHKTLLISNDFKFTLSNACAEQAGGKLQSWFVLPPAWEYYFKKKHPGYTSPPPLKPGGTLPDLTASRTSSYSRRFLSSLNMS